MNVNCVKCGSPLDADFGMITCAECGEILLVDLSGEVQSAGETVQKHVDDVTGSEAQEPQTRSGVDGIDLDLGPTEEVGEKLDLDDLVENAEGEEDKDRPPKYLENSGVFEQKLSEIDQAEPDDLQRDSAQDHEGDFKSWDYDPELQGGLDAPEANPRATKDPSDLGGLVEFANSEEATAREGKLLYNLLIEGIETKEIKDAIGDALSDRRFGWDPNRVIQGLKDGRLEITNVNPLKASVLVRRLKALNVKISWEQHGLGPDI